MPEVSRIGVARIPRSEATSAAPRPTTTPTVGLGPVARADPRAAARRDRMTLEGIVNGRIDPTEGLRQIAMSGGLPIVADGKTTFVALDDRPLAVAGDANGWRPSAMSARGPIQILQVDGERSGRYKLVDRAGEYFADPWARAYAHDDNGEMSLVRPTGPHLERFPLVSGFGLPPRTVRVWVPKEAPTHHLYVQDGQNLFDPRSMFGGWHLDETVSDRTLVVGIDNTGLGRMDEYTHTEDRVDGRTYGGRADDYAKLLLSVVRPHVEKTYGAPRRAGILGSSLGGLAAFAVVSEHPNAFDFAGAMSGTFGWGRMGDGVDNETMGERFQRRSSSGGRRRTKLYLDSGGAPGGGDNHDVTRQMANTLASIGYRWDRDLWHWHEPNAGHNEKAWRDRAWRPVRIFESL